MSSEEKQTQKLLLVDDDVSLLRLLSIRLTSEGYQVVSASSGNEAMQSLKIHDYDVVLTDLRMPGMDGLTLFKRLVDLGKSTPVILMTAHGTIEDAVAATKEGVAGFLTKPIDHNALRQTLENAILAAAPMQGKGWATNIITRSPCMQSVLEQAYRVAQRDISVLISGPSGAGKELLANAIHQASPRKDKPFVPINCGALPENLLESELFGHSKGAFTGAVSQHKGLFQQADGGTLFLDEIGDMPIPLQVKLLRALQERKIRPVGATTEISIDVRVLSATHRNLTKEMEKGRFREDLYYRLNVVNLVLPSLTERAEDIPLLARHLLQQISKQIGVRVNGFAPDAMQALVTASWPGNIRQLVNTVEQCVALTDTKTINLHLVKQALSSTRQTWPTLAEARVSFEREYLIKLLKMTEGNVTRAADLAGRNRTDLHKLLKKYELNAEQYR
ncbi:sigma 54-interacting transcriptional regulator [Alteromonas sp. 5E99-2]|uniref:sigma 54-interacting transcriptional regulator n=1 Tax=Alteromonas sp. 5E99-2 TaxID=2817683 RepID=UPI001A9839C4|nr:sigma 54-interacting transcriptional regulator [Alteromonas sp. 5E99-2]MBO1254208.1 sigma 54-interacting transcriptional regulator [Alteromonas sp. 5E99-2]